MEQKASYRFNRDIGKRWFGNGIVEERKKVATHIPLVRTPWAPSSGS